MVKIELCWSREHVENMLVIMKERLANDSKAEYFNVNLFLDGCNICIERGEIKQ